MNHPLAAVSAGRRWPIFAPLFLLTVVVMVILNITGAPLQTESAPQGIVSFELAGTVAKSKEILDSWDAHARVHAGFNLGFDFLFLVLYSTAIAFACAWIASALPGSLRFLSSAGLLLAWGQWLAAVLDAIENTGLLVILLSAPAVPWPQLAQWCAVVKFALVLLGLLYALFGAVWAITRAAQRT